ncbi:hypothetical protein AHF37_08675 [Paragonimus kellicotti]|nr:hypothetical protein AHF37_08675 [Paragonimus kellicotti]
MGHLWEMVVVSKTNYDHNGHCRGRGNSALPHCRRLRWELSEQVNSTFSSLRITVPFDSLQDNHLMVSVHECRFDTVPKHLWFLMTMLDHQLLLFTNTLARLPC